MRKRMTPLNLHPGCTQNQIRRPDYHKTSNKEEKENKKLAKKIDLSFFFLSGNS